jgi:hypothetical protein
MKLSPFTLGLDYLDYRDETTKVSLELPLLKLGMKQEPELDDY